ncbi:MAG: ABC transporter permease [Planctomycetes bacterium]|nr:ABC transporter permease [Planctomycetota bacterium]
MISRYKRELSVTAALLVMLAVLAVFAPSFFGADNLRAIRVSNAPVLVAVIGMTLVILARHIDISIGSQFSICGIVAGMLAKQGVPAPVVALATLALGAAFGAINGGLVAGLNLPSIVVTLATMGTWRESRRWITEGETVRNLPESFLWLGMSRPAGQTLIVLVSLALLALFAAGLKLFPAGRAVYAVGSDAEAARLAGIRPRRVVFGVFVLMGALTALAALLTAIQFRNVQPNEGAGLEMKVIAAAVVGGVAISGGRGTLIGAFVGVLLLGMIAPALVFLEAEPYWEKAIQGAIILIAVASDAINLRQRRDVGASLAAH